MCMAKIEEIRRAAADVLIALERLEQVRDEFALTYDMLPEEQKGDFDGTTIRQRVAVLNGILDNLEQALEKLENIDT